MEVVLLADLSLWHLWPLAPTNSNLWFVFSFLTYDYDGYGNPTDRVTPTKIENGKKSRDLQKPQFLLTSENLFSENIYFRWKHKILNSARLQYFLSYYCRVLFGWTCYNMIKKFKKKWKDQCHSHFMKTWLTSLKVIFKFLLKLFLWNCGYQIILYVCSLEFFF